MTKLFKTLLVVMIIVVVVELDHSSNISIPDLYLEPNIIYKDRNKNILRWIPDENGERNDWVDLDKIPEIVQQAFISAEDQRFYTHHGVDYLAILRAVKSNLIGGRIVSGASTITQQISRLAYPRSRTYQDKLIEV